MIEVGMPQKYKPMKLSLLSKPRKFYTFKNNQP